MLLIFPEKRIYQGFSELREGDKCIQDFGGENLKERDHLGDLR